MFLNVAVPLNLQTNIYYESNNCTLTWQAPKMTEQHGLPLYYIINCTTEDDYTIIYANDTDQNLEVLSYTFYSCCVSGVNEVGIGSPACQTFITYESGKFN